MGEKARTNFEDQLASLSNQISTLRASVKDGAFKSPNSDDVVNEALRRQEAKWLKRIGELENRVLDISDDMRSAWDAVDNQKSLLDQVVETVTTIHDHVQKADEPSTSHMKRTQQYRTPTKQRTRKTGGRRSGNRAE